MRGSLRVVFGALGVLGATGLTIGIGAPASAGPGGGGNTVEVRALDKCDPATFNAALNDPTACVPVRTERHPLTFLELVQSADPVTHLASPAWTFTRTGFGAKPGDTIRFVNRGGETHTFTEVPAFGPGCVPPVNAFLGYGIDAVPVADCGAAFAGAIPGGGTATSTVGGSGVHRYICVIHPWMRSTVTVEG
jgi:plastocyanin